MSGGPYVLRIPMAGASPVVRVPAPAPGMLVRNISVGMQGPPGPQGANGYAKRFGTIDYTDNDAGTSLPAHRSTS